MKKNKKMDWLLEMIKSFFSYGVVILGCLFFLLSYRIAGIIILFFYFLSIPNMDVFLKHFQFMVKHPLFTIMCLFLLGGVVEYLKTPVTEDELERRRRATEEEKRIVDDYRRRTGQR